MSNDGQGDLQIYSYFSDCLKNFRHRMLLLCKISNVDYQDTYAQLNTTLGTIINQGSMLLNKFQEFEQSVNNIHNVFSRFLLRVRESLHTIINKTSACDLLNFFGFLENIIKQFNFSSNMLFLMKIILLKIPKPQILPHISSENATFEKNQSDFNKKDIKNQITMFQAKSQKHFDSYDKYLQALESQYRLFDCMNIQKLQYRRVFFLALQDLQRKDNNLLQQMMFRNKYAKQSLILYEKNFEKQKKKQHEKQLRMIREQQKLTLTELKTKDLAYQNFKGKLREDQTKSFTISKRFKTQMDSQQQMRATKIPLISQTLRSLPNKKFINFKERLKTMNSPHPIDLISQQQAFTTSYKVIQVDKPKNPKNAHPIKLKKVQFGQNKIQLAPQKIQKSTGEQSDEKRKQNFYKKTQEHFRKKVSFITQIKFPKNLTYKLENFITNNSKFNSIRIDFSKFLQ